MTGSASDEEDGVRRKLEKLKGRGAAPPPQLETDPHIGRERALDPLCQSLLDVAREALAKGDVPSAAEALEGLLDVVPAGHVQRAELEAFERTVRALAARPPRGDRAPSPAEVVDPALSAGYLLMAAQDGELTAEEAAALEERLGPADGALRVEWGWLETARAALGRVATFEPAGDDPVWERLRTEVRLGLDRPAPREPATVDASELERMRREMEQRDVEMRALISGLAGALATRPTPAAGDVAKQLRALQTSLADQLRRSIGTLGAGGAKDFDLSPDAAAALFASGRDEPAAPDAPPRRRAPAEREPAREERDLDDQAASVFSDALDDFFEQLERRAPGEPPAEGARAGGPAGAVRAGHVLGSLEVATLHLPARAEPGGDLADVHPRPGGLDVVLLDASGRGPPAHAAAFAARVGVQAALAAGAAPAAALAATNEVLHRTTARDVFVAGTLVRWDEARGVALLTGAGGEAAVVGRARRGAPLQFERVKPGGVVLGAVRDAPPFPTRELELAPGDLLLLVSDGVTELLGPRGEPYCDAGWERLLALVARSGDLEAAAFVASLEAELRAWGSLGQRSPADDVVVVALRRRRGLVTEV